MNILKDQTFKDTTFMEIKMHDFTFKLKNNLWINPCIMANYTILFIKLVHNFEVRYFFCVIGLLLGATSNKEMEPTKNSQENK